MSIRSARIVLLNEDALKKPFYPRPFERSDIKLDTEPQHGSYIKLSGLECKVLNTSFDPVAGHLEVECGLPDYLWAQNWRRLETEKQWDSGPY